MTRYAGLSLQHNTYIVRVAVPADVRKIIGKRELIQSLRTGDFGEATKKWGPVYKAFKAQIEQARAKGAINALDLQPARLALANWATAEGQKPIVDGDDTDTPWLVQKRIADYERAWTDPSGWEGIPDFDDKAVEMLTAGGSPTRLGDPILAPLRQEVALHLMYAERHNERRRLIAARERLVEAARGADLDDVGAIPERPSKPLPAPSVTLQKLYDEWVAPYRSATRKRAASRTRRVG